MKKTVYAIMIIAATVLCGCKKEKNQEGIGTLQMTLSAGGEYITKSTNTDVREFVVTIVRPADGWTREYPRFADMPQKVDLASGTYQVTASSLNQLPAAFDQPVYSGTAEFTIAAGEMTPVSLVCTLANMKVTIVPSENFKNELSYYDVTITNSASWTASDVEEHTLVWKQEDIEAGTAGYFSVAPLLVKVQGKRAIDNTEATAELAISSVAAKDHHIINLDARVTGEAVFELIIDPSVNERESDIFVPGWDEKPVDGGEQGGDDPNPDDPNPDDPPVVDPTLPTVIWEANPDFAPVTMQSSGMNVELEIDVPKKIATFGVDVESSVLSETIAQLSSSPDYTYAPGHPFFMDMIYDDTLCENLGGMGLGLPLKDDLLGQTHVSFSLSGLIPLALMYQPTPLSEHYFTLKLTDEAGNVLEKLITFVAPEQ